MAAVARGSSVQFRMRPSELGSTMSAGSASLNTRMSTSNSGCMMCPVATAALLIINAVGPRPVDDRIFQMGPLLPSVRPYRRVSRWRW